MAVATLAASILTGTSPTATAAPGDTASTIEPDDKIEPTLAAKLDARDDAAMWVRFEAKADLTSASAIIDWTERGAAVAAALRQTADSSQAAVRAQLDRAGVDYHAYWATNAIYVDHANRALADRLARRDEVEGLYAPRSYETPDPIPGKRQARVAGVEWGVADINAPQVWSNFGINGEGITVANIDTGVQFDHPALVNQYRGNLGDGTFDHNYNWFDASGICDEGPCDEFGHGTHTMGTMVGDDGAGNQVGVAPGARWIAANGVDTGPDDDIIAAGQWMLEPTDLNGQNPDASKRPNIINNSWGVPGATDPFMEDVVAAWDAAGIFSAWANGNEGPACESVIRMPNALPITFTAGAYDVNRSIADFSSRGPGLEDVIKPNLASPGVDVRSSVPGDGYDVLSGTSMATPHLAGAVALAWSAAPALVGDVQGTEDLLDETVVDTPDDQCGGTDDDNNVWGEGRLDALALLDSAPIGDTGVLTGTVTDAGTGDPIAGAAVAIDGEVDRDLTTGTDGSYQARLPVGAYEVEVSSFGYVSTLAGDIPINKDETTTYDVALEPAPTVNVSGQVTDGSGHGWPVYAKVSVSGAPPDVFDYTDPGDGRYSLQLPAGATHTLNVEPQYPGYEPVSEDVEVGDGDVTHDFAVSVDDRDCDAAPGYSTTYNGLYQTFDAPQKPADWTVFDHNGSGYKWTFDDPAGRGNETGGDGPFAIVDADFNGPDANENTSLQSPSVDLTGVDEPVVRFKQSFVGLEGQVGRVVLSVDGGPWKKIYEVTGDTTEPAEVAIPRAAGKANVRVRFRFFDPDWGYWWQVDDVLIGSATCDLVPGGLVVGHVRNALDDAAINGATVTSEDAPEESVSTMATPDDPGLDDGFFWMFSSLTGEHPFTASATNYTPQTNAVDVAPNWATETVYELGAGRLEVEPASLAADVKMGASEQRTFTVSNTGTAAADVEVTERRGSFEIEWADGTSLTEDEIMSSPGAKVRRVKGDYSPLRADLEAMETRSKRNARRTSPADEPWTNVTDYPFTVQDSTADVLDGKVYNFGGVDGDAFVITAEGYVYDPTAQTWDPLAPMPEGRENPAGAFIDGLFYLNGGWAEDGSALASTIVYDPASDSWSEAAEAPVGAAAAGRAVVDGQLYVVGGCQDTCGLTDVRRYDPAADAWESLAEYPEPTSHVACGALDGDLVCAGGVSDQNGPSVHTYAYDAGSNTWAPRGDMPADLWGMDYLAANGSLLVSGGITGDSVTNEGFAYDPAADTWSELPASNNTVLRGAGACGFYKIGGDTGGFVPIAGVEVLPGFDDCEATSDVPWLQVDPAAFTLRPGESATVTVTMTADVAQPGTYTAGVGIKSNTPYKVDPVAVSMHVLPPNTWGKLAGTVTGIECDGARHPIAGAIVEVDSWAMEITLITEADGTYAHWLDRRNNPLTMIVAKDGWKPQTRQVRIKAGETTTQNFALKKIGC